MYKIYRLFYLIILPFLLSACFATKALIKAEEKSKEDRWVATNITDKILAIGKPTKPINGYENALVLVGEKHNYLIELVNSPKADLQSIFESIDLSYVTIGLHDRDHIAVKQKAGDHHDGYHACPSSFGCAYIGLSFLKPLVLVTYKEKENLQRLGFSCSKYIDNRKLHCFTGYNKIAFTVVQKTTQPNSLSHRFQYPLSMVYYEFHANKGETSSAVFNTLLPLAIIVDVVTFPIQAQFLDIRK